MIHVSWYYCVSILYGEQYQQIIDGLFPLTRFLLERSKKKQEFGKIICTCQRGFAMVSFRSIIVVSLVMLVAAMRHQDTEKVRQGCDFSIFGSLGL